MNEKGDRLLLNDKHDNIKAQFDGLAAEYDSIKKKNAYYFSYLKKVFERRITDRNSKVIEIGCGTGEILGTLNPKAGAGVDISPAMIKAARSKYPAYSFYCQGIEDLAINEEFDYIIVPDVIEYVADPEKAFCSLKKLCKKSTKVIITSPNPFWAFILGIAEKLNLKMKDKFSKPPSRHRVISAAEGRGFRVVECSTRLLVPKKILFSDRVNETFYRIPIVRNLGFIQVFVLENYAAG